MAASAVAMMRPANVGFLGVDVVSHDAGNGVLLAMTEPKVADLAGGGFRVLAVNRKGGFLAGKLVCQMRDVFGQSIIHLIELRDLLPP